MQMKMKLVINVKEITSIAFPSWFIKSVGLFGCWAHWLDGIQHVDDDDDAVVVVVGSGGSGWMLPAYSLSFVWLGKFMRKIILIKFYTWRKTLHGCCVRFAFLFFIVMCGGDLSSSLKWADSGMQGYLDLNFVWEYLFSFPLFVLYFRWWVFCYFIWVELKFSSN